MRTSRALLVLGPLFASLLITDALHAQENQGRQLPHRLRRWRESLIGQSSTTLRRASGTSLQFPRNLTHRSPRCGDLFRLEILVHAR